VVDPEWNAPGEDAPKAEQIHVPAACCRAELAL
jgi:hypothetical protein